MAGIEKDINYLGSSLLSKGPIHLAIFIFPLLPAFYEIQSDKHPSALEHLQKPSESMPNIRIHIFFC